ncbi:MAG: CHRD domain-containing protein [Alphaproteobacteria bacterium]|nr:CHRD domain-containing protein [Alphaproteobacteria bacterium]
MRRYDVTASALAAAVVAFLASYAIAEEFTAHLKGFNEIGSIPTTITIPATTPPTSVSTGYTGAVLSDGTGTAKLDLDKEAGTIDYTLTYSNVGTTPPQTGMVSQAHIHFGKSHDSGGILVFFCTNLGNGPTGVMTQSCPANSGTVTGTWTKANVAAIPGQNVAAGDFDALVDALESNTAYANIHTTPLPGGTNTAYPGGEIRGQVHAVEKDHDHDQNHR